MSLVLDCSLYGPPAGQYVIMSVQPDEHRLVRAACLGSRTSTSEPTFTPSTKSATGAGLETGTGVELCAAAEDVLAIKRTKAVATRDTGGR